MRKRDLESMIECECKVHGDPEPEAKAWAATLSEVERRRDKYQEMFAADAVTINELRVKLVALEETRETAQCELAALVTWREGLQAPERDNRLLGFYIGLAPRALAGLDLARGRTVYSTFELCVGVRPVGASRFAARFERRNRLG